jgi:uncharacterized membrane protein YbjE (DUF340 family)
VTTETGLLVAIVFLLALEGWSLKNKRERDTISEVTWRVTMRKPFIAFLVGFLMGHLFWFSERCAEVLK